MTRTRGVSRKLLAPVHTALVAVVSTWILTGSLSREELVLLAVAALGFAFGWLVPADDVEVDAPQGVEVVSGEDLRLSVGQSKVAPVHERRFDE